MGEQKKSKKVVRAAYKLRYGGDEMVDRNGISTENHQQMYRRLVQAGDQGIHNRPGAPKPRKST